MQGQFFQQLGRAQDRVGHLLLIEGTFVREHRGFHQRGGGPRPGFALGKRAIHLADQAISGGIQAAIRRKLIANAAGEAKAEHAERLEFQRSLVFQRMEIAPAGVEFARHADAILAQFACIARRNREVQIAPAAAGQAFQFEMRIGLFAVFGAGANVPRVVKNGAAVVVFAHKSAHLLLKAVDGLLGEGAHLRFIAKIQAFFQHFLAAGRAGAGPDAHDIEK